MAIKEQIKGKSTGEGVLKYFQNISADRKNGIFVLKTKEGKEIQILFYDGKIIYAESDVKNRDRAILTYLSECGIIDKKVKTKILKKKEKSKGVSIISLLIEEKPGTEDEMGQALRARTQEILIELLMSEEVSFEFIEKGKGEIGFNPKIYRPMNTDSIIFDAARIIDELKNALEPAKVYENIPSLSGTIDVETAKKLRIPWEFIEYIDGKSAIIEIARKSRKPVYETMIYISELSKNELVEIERSKELRSEEERDKRWEIIKLSFKNIIAFLFIGFTGVFLYGLTSSNSKEKIKIFDPFEVIKVEKQKLKIKTAIESYKTLEGRYPDSLLLLVEKGLLEKKDLTFPINRLYYYKKSEDDTYYELGL